MTGVPAVRITAATHRGLVRADNQDVVVLDGWASGADDTRSPELEQSLDRPVAVAVVDGMGGYRGGELAAWITAQALVRTAGTVHDAHTADALAQRTHDTVSGAGAGVGLPDMGAAFVALVLDADGFGVCNVGDCRAYRLSEGALGLLSMDDAGPSRRDPTRTVLTQSIGGGGAQRIDAHWFAAPWSASGPQRFLLASDGLAVLSRPQIASVLEAGDTAACAASLVSATLAAGAPDNVSVIVADIQPAARRQQ